MSSELQLSFNKINHEAQDVPILLRKLGPLRARARHVDPYQKWSL